MTDVIKQFLTTHEIQASVEDFNTEEIKLLTEIVNGQIADTYENPMIVYYVGLFYQSQNMLDKSIEYLMMAHKKGFKNATDTLVLIYMSIKDDKVKCTDGELLRLIGKKYEDQKTPDLAEKYYMKAITKGDSDAIFSLGVMYNTQNEFRLAEKFFLMCIESGKKIQFGWLGNAYFSQKKYDDAVKYYLMSIDNSENYGAYNAANSYKIKNNTELARKYSLLALDTDIKDEHIKNTIEYLQQVNPMILYNKLAQIKNPKAIIVEEISRLKKSKEIRYYDNKLRFGSKKDQCPICLEDDVTVIPFDCFHYYCVDCYVTIGKCSLCGD